MATVESSSPRGHIQQPPRVSTVRERILEEHRMLRHRLDFLELAVDGLHEDPKRRSTVNRAARDALRLLVSHTQLEDAILAPVLKALDPWGEARARNLLEHHVVQREHLHALITSYAQPYENLEDVTVRTLAWIADVRSDMAHEERGLLSHEILAGESIANDGEAG